MSGPTEDATCKQILEVYGEGRNRYGWNHRRHCLRKPNASGFCPQHEKMNAEIDARMKAALNDNELEEFDRNLGKD